MPFASAKMMIPQPYLAVVDPGGGKTRRTGGREAAIAIETRRETEVEVGAGGPYSGRDSHRVVKLGHPGMLRQHPALAVRGVRFIHGGPG